MKKRKLLALCLVPALLAGCAAPAGVTDLSRQFEARMNRCWRWLGNTCALFSGCSRCFC